ncbi:hypothetical protein OIU74_020010 [Salix koriyanagi]|uniref:Uncharacterized protein n=1 Tax=Salix koriyanagi TaxID=2511006 RepID=A0A9Q0P5K8_9ROSI|nr:hypothetical protein OIU74_020010 [Salix koriyanagi]
MGSITTAIHLDRSSDISRPNAHLGDLGEQLSSQRLPQKTLNIADSLVTNERKEYQLSLSYKSQRNIRGRFDHAGDPWMWCDAKAVDVCKGPLDVALLRLE